jgi:hypothetical protein
MNAKYIRIALTVLWSSVFLYNLWGFSMDIVRSNPRLYCDDGSCIGNLLFLPLLTLFLFLIWKPVGRGWIKHVLFSFILMIVVLVGFWAVLYFGQELLYSR